METNISKVEHKENPFILDIILKYKLYQEFKIEPHFITVYGLYIDTMFRNGYKPFRITARIEEEDFNKIQIGNYLTDITVNNIRIPHHCYISSVSMNLNYPYFNHYEITLYFYT